MEVVSKEEFQRNEKLFVERIKGGAIFIYPTDTIYGIGCDATNDEAVQKLRTLKDRSKNPFSVIVPSRKWIYSHCDVSEEADQWVEKLPGPYTLILKTKKHAVSKYLAPGLDTLGVRIPKHWFSAVVEKLGIPIVTTSANKSGKDFMTSLKDLDEALKKAADFIIYEGEKKGDPSQLVDLTGKPRLIQR